MSAPREIIPSHYGKEIISDDHFRSANGAKDFFKRKDRSKSYEMPNVSGVRTISWNASGAYLASGSDNRVVSVGNLDPHSCRLKQTFVGYGHEDIVEAIEFAKRDEMKMASCSSDKSVRLWDLRNPSSHTKLSTPGANLFVTWSYCDNYIIFGDKSDNLGVIDARAMKTVEVFTFKDEINEFVCHPNGQLIFVATDLGKLEVLSLPKLKRIRTVQAHPPLSTCISVTLSPNERFLAVGASDACCSVWDINDMICVQTLTRLDYPVRSVSFSHCSNLIASGSEDRVIDISWTQTGEKITEIPIATECYDVAWHPKLYLLAYAIKSLAILLFPAAVLNLL
uniref:THO complex subunit 3 n=1 Tax=Globodera rostochiensis TaxID=31243 RepID=A0A914I5R3_GLORO